MRLGRRPGVAALTIVIAAGLTMLAPAAPGRAGVTAASCDEPAGVVCPPHVGHVWTIVLENSGLYTSFGLGQVAAPYLARTLPLSGAFVPNYYGTGHSSLDNYIAMTSGQAPNTETQGDCTEPSQLGGDSPTPPDPATGQAIGPVGCVYPAVVPNLASQLRAAHVSWKSYNETMDAHPAGDGEPLVDIRRTHCQGPDTYQTGGLTGMYYGAPDPDADPNTANQPQRDEYRSKHNPFVYYRNITDDLDYCDAHDVPLGAWKTDDTGGGSYDQFGTLVQDLRREATTPAYSFITPNQCSDGHDACPGGAAGGNDQAAKLAQMDAFVQQAVKLIQASAAYNDPVHPGLIVITFDEGTDSLACCDEQPSPELAYEAANGESFGPQGPQNGTPFGPGGGIVGAVLVSSLIKPGTVSRNVYNHYSYLRTMEDIFGVGHIGYAADSAYPGSGATDAQAPGGPPRPFGPDIFSAAPQ